MTGDDLLILLALGVPLFAAAVTYAVGRMPDVRETMTLVACIALSIITISMFTRTGAGHPPSLVMAEPISGVEIAFRLEPLGALFAVMASVLWGVNSLFSIGYMRGKREAHQTRFYMCFALAMFGVMGVAMASNLFTLFIFYEVLTFSTYPLVIHRGDEAARKAGRVYLATLVGSRASDSGGNSMAPAGMIDLSVRPTKVDRASDVTGLVDTGQLASLLSLDDTVAVMEAIQRISDRKLQVIDPKQPWADPKQTTVTRNEVVKELVNCGYVKAADVVDRYGDPTSLNPDLDPDIVGPGGIFSRAEYDGDDEFRKTAAVMKMVLSGYAGAGTITLGGYDYHGQGRSTGELRDLRAGRCMGACLEYAARRGLPLMLYVYSDGSISASGQVDNTVDGRGKFMWTSDNQSTAASFFLVYNPGGRPNLVSSGASGAARHQQIGYFRSDASVETASSPAAANVNLLVETVVLNYMALHGEQGQFASRFPRHGLGNATLQDSLVAFNPIVSGRIG